MKVGLTLDQVAKMLKVSRERIRQIEAYALRKLRHPTRSVVLKEIMRGGEIMFNKKKKALTDIEKSIRKETHKLNFLLKHFPVGYQFDYIGASMTVRTVHAFYSVYMICDYLDDKGVIQQYEFRWRQLRVIWRQANGSTRT